MTDVTNNIPLTADELTRARSAMRTIGRVLRAELPDDNYTTLREYLRGKASLPTERDSHQMPTLLTTLETAALFASEVDSDAEIISAILLYSPSGETPKEASADVAQIISRLATVMRFTTRGQATSQENFRGLLISLAHDIRVIIIMIVRSLALMRAINHHPDDEWVRQVAFEAGGLYAQLAHRLGLYKIKSQLEDLSLKYTNREIYTQIARKLNETKRDRDAYIARFIAPLKAKLEAEGLHFDIKGRTKSISSIWAKIRKQKVDVSQIYDLFAIRVIIDTPLEREKSDCWLAYSVLANMYTANPARMRDWISLPKSNGYESLHATVMGPEGKWVEVQFRTRRMDLVAEKGLAAHWRYKGVKGDSTDQWMNNIRDILESAENDPMQMMKGLRTDVFDREVYAFTPKGDLFRLPQGATVLDFAYHIHSNVGSHCTGAVVDGKHEKISYRIKNGDTIEILTSSQQSPKQDWLNIAVSPRAKNKIRQTLNEDRQRMADLGKEQLERRIRNRKLEVSEALVMKAIKKAGYKMLTDFYADLAEEKIDINRFIQTLADAERKEHEQTVATASAEGYTVAEADDTPTDAVVIGDRNIRGLNYKMAGCCRPVFGDDVFGFVSADGVVKIHRTDCRNAPNIKEKYPYRIIPVKWASSAAAGYMPATLRIVGHDDIGIVANITSIITKEPGVVLRNISVDSDGGMFQGHLVIGVTDTQRIGQLEKKIRTVKGVKGVYRT